MLRLDELNRKAIALMEELRGEAGTETVVISGCIGPQDDGYSPDTKLSADEAANYHSTQIETFADTAVDMVTAMTMTYAGEAIGTTRAAAAAGLPARSHSRWRPTGGYRAGRRWARRSPRSTRRPTAARRTT